MESIVIKMSPSSAGNGTEWGFRCWLRRTRLPFLLSFLICFRIARAQCCDTPDNHHHHHYNHYHHHHHHQQQLSRGFERQYQGSIITSTSSRIFSEIPDEGISLLSDSSILVTEFFLDNDDIDDVVYNYAFRAPSGSSLTDYSISFTCDNLLIYNSSTCTITNAETDVENSSEKVYNTTVACTFNKFPGTTDCRLIAASNTIASTTATLFSDAASRPIFADVDENQESQSSTITLQNEDLPFSPFSDLYTTSMSSFTSPSSLQQDEHHFPPPNLNQTSMRQQTQFTSITAKVNVYGYVFYIPDATGTLTSDAIIVSGPDRKYALSSYDRTDAGVRELESYAYFPGNSSLEGSFNFLDSATLSTSFSDVILWYDTSTCNANFYGDSAQFESDGSFNLTNSNECGIGLAIKDNTSFPTLGFQFRKYKSGNFTFTLTWPPFGDREDEYTQIQILEIIEPAPPIITGVTKLDEYGSVPCGSETLAITIMNVRFSTGRELVVYDADGIPQRTWKEILGFSSYNSELDHTTLQFDSAGGSGTDVSFNVTATFPNDSGTDETRTAVMFDDSIELANNYTLSFSSAPQINSMSPSTVAKEGGEIITLTGTFENFDNLYSVFVGGYELSAPELTTSGTTQISFTAPAQDLVGVQHVYNVTARRCAERSNAVLLTYIELPKLTIIPLGLLYDETNDVYTLPLDYNATFLAEVTGNNYGIVYSWQIAASDGTPVTLDASISSSDRRFSFSPLLLSDSETYSLTATVENSLGLSDSQQLSFGLAASGTDYALVKVFGVGVLSKSVQYPTLVQAMLNSTLNEIVTLVWKYGNTLYEYNASESRSEDTFTTGPTKFGLEFYIERNDLVVGNTLLSLTASYVSNPSITDTDSTVIQVVGSDLQAFINEGINGTLVQSVNDVRMTGEKSRDPDVLGDGESDTAGISYSWTLCRKSLDVTFSSNLEDCSSLFPTDRTVQSFNITATALLAERLDTGTDPQPTYFSFGLEVSKDVRRSNAYLYFEFRTVETAERVPTLSSIDIVDTKGNALDKTGLSILSDIVIQPTAPESIVEWEFDMVRLSQRYLFSQGNILLSGPTFVSSRNEKSRLALGFAAGKLDPGTEYIVSVLASANDTSLQTSYQVSFRTGELPNFSCQGPAVTEGFISETVFLISANSSYMAQEIEYCFFLVDEFGLRFSVGKGCSSVAHASFTFPREGVYDILCEARSISGVILRNQTLDSNITLTLPPQDESLSEVEILEEKLTNMTKAADKCELLRDHSCISSIIIATNELAFQINQIALSESSAQVTTLQDNLSAFVERLSALSEELAENTVFKPNQVEDSIDETFYLVHVPSQLIGGENTYYQMLSQMDGAVGILRTGSTSVQSNQMVDKVVSIVNVTLTNAYLHGTKGTSRRRLLQEQGERGPYADLLIRILEYVADVRKQQERCGYVGAESTLYPVALIQRVNSGDSETLSTLDPCEVNIIIACDEEQIDVEIGRNVEAVICPEAVGVSNRSRVEGVVTEIPSANVIRTGMVSDVDVYTQDMAYVQLDGVDNIPARCVSLVFRRDPNKIEETEYDQVRAGILAPTETETGKGCTAETCFNFVMTATDEPESDELDIRISTSTEGLVVVGNMTRAAPPPSVSLEGEGYGVLRNFLGTALPIMIFVAVAGVATWIMLSRAVAPYPEVDDLGWEYVERDMFGRGSVETTTFTPAAANQENVGSAFQNLANRQSMEKRVSTRGGTAATGDN